MSVGWLEYVLSFIRQNLMFIHVRLRLFICCQWTVCKSMKAIFMHRCNSTLFLSPSSSCPLLKIRNNCV